MELNMGKKRRTFSIFETFTITSILMMTFVIIVQSCTIVGITKSLREVQNELSVQKEVIKRTGQPGGASEILVIDRRGRNL
jgi:hypothetical protein